MFVCDGAAAAADFGTRGYAAWSAGVEAEFLAHAQAQVEADFEFADDDDALARIVGFAGALTATPAREWILAERQLKGYGHGVGEAANLHKDRAASELAIGVVLHLAAPSAVVLYPDHAREPNCFPTAQDHGARLRFSARPEVALEGVTPVRIPSVVGSVVAFPGASVFHGRERGAGTVVLYLKLNRMGLDPTGADPRTYAGRRRSLALVGRDDAELAGLELCACPLLTRVVRERCRVAGGWQEVELAQVAGHKELLLSASERRILLAAPLPTAAPISVAALLAGLEIQGDRALILAQVRDLVRGGALDLREPAARAA